MVFSTNFSTNNVILQISSSGTNPEARLPVIRRKFEDIADVRDSPENENVSPDMRFELYKNVSVDQRILMHEEEDFEKPAGGGTEPVH